eukprot:COSAG01_NODE_129_length_24935_cov_39.324368_15_plen_88_part_00
MDYNNTCGGGGGGGAWRYGCKDSPLDACSAKLSHETCNADRGCSWCLSKSKNVPQNLSSCVPLANVSGWVNGNACWNTTCTKVPGPF